MWINSKSIFYVLMVLCAAYAMTYCSSKSEKQDRQNLEQSQNVHQAQQEQWEILFGGESLDNWRNYKSDKLRPAWQVVDGNMVLTEGRKGGAIVTKKEYGNFELTLEWKIPEGANSGIFYRVAEHDTSGAMWHSAPEYQLLDNGNNPAVDHQAASVYDLIPPNVDATNPVGQWNKTRIIVNEAHVEHWLNGKKVVEYELWSDSWKEKVANSKFNQHPEYGMKKKGHIGLQDHAHKIWFRNIKIREL